MKATPVDAGWRVPFVSNCHDASWLGAIAIVTKDGEPVRDANGEPRVVAVYLPMSDCRIIDTWSVMGMRGTGSHDVVVEDAFVPRRRTYPYVPEFEPGSHFRGPPYRFPMVDSLVKSHGRGHWKREIIGAGEVEERTLRSR